MKQISEQEVEVMFRRLYRILLIYVALIVVAMQPAWSTIPDFTFIHISDEHSGAGPSTAQTIADLVNISSINMQPYGITAIAPTFVIETGDMTEFGPKNGSWESLNQSYSLVSMPRYMALGNHDGTWRSLSCELTKLYGAPYYSFDRCGCHFVILDSAGFQDPRPVINPEELNWLKFDLAKVGPDAPVFVAMHHPLDCGEYSSRYEVERLVDVLRPYNVVLLMVGHGHSTRYCRYEGLDMVEGGSAYGPDVPGFQVVSIKDGMLRVAFKEHGNPNTTRPMLEKSIAPPAQRYPALDLQLPREGCTYGNMVPVKAWIKLVKDQVKSASAEIDGSQKVDLAAGDGGCYSGTFDASKLAAGAHYLKVTFTSPDESTYSRSTFFYADSDEVSVRWRANLGSASKSAPAATAQSVFVGTNDGKFFALNAKTGKVKWIYKTGGAVSGGPVICSGHVIFGSEDGNLYCVAGTSGKLVWEFGTGQPIYSSPVCDGKSIYFGAGDGSFFCVDAKSGKLMWKNSDATYNIEIRPFLASGRVYFGAWDTYVYSIDTSTGKLAWKCMGQGSAEGNAPAYYSPADCGPVVIIGKVYVADRKYRLSVIDEKSGVLDKYVEKVSAVGSGSNCIFLRMTSGFLVKLNEKGEELWRADVSMDDEPTPPVESDGVVYVCSKRGLVSAVKSDTGKILWQYHATPSSFVTAGMGAYGSSAYVVGTDGVLTALAR